MRSLLGQPHKIGMFTFLKKLNIVNQLPNFICVTSIKVSIIISF